MTNTNFFFNDTATTEIYTLSLHDALPISAPMRMMPRSSRSASSSGLTLGRSRVISSLPSLVSRASTSRSEEHTSELQSRQYLVCRLLLDKKNMTVNFAVETTPADTQQPDA